MENQINLKNIYKKSLAINLIRMGHDLHHTMRNKDNPKYQVYVMVETPEMIADLLKINELEEKRRNSLYKHKRIMLQLNRKLDNEIPSAI